MATAGVVIYWLRFIRPSPLSALGLRGSGSDLGLGVVFGVVMLVVASIVGATILGIARAILGIARAILGHPVHLPQRIPRSVRGAWFWVTGPVIFLVAPVAEEIFFRGFLYRAVRRRFSVPWSVVISAAVFAIAHIYLLSIPVIFVDGVILALLFEWRQSLATSIAAHAANNLLIFLILLSTRT